MKIIISIISVILIIGALSLYHESEKRAAYQEGFKDGQAHATKWIMKHANEMLDEQLDAVDNAATNQTNQVVNPEAEISDLLKVLNDN